LCLNTRLSVNKIFLILIIFIEIYVTVSLLFSHPLMISIIYHNRRPNTQENVSYLFDFHFTNNIFFRTLRSRNTRFHIAPFRSTCYVLKRFGCLNVSNGVFNWNKGKKLIIVWWILQICHLEIPVFFYKLMYECSLWISFSYGFCEFNRVANWNKDNTIVLEQSSLQICQLELLVSYWT